MRFFYLDGQRKVDEGEVADLNFVLQIENAGGGHVGIGVILREIAHRDTGMQRGRLVENGLRIPEFQLAQKQRQVHNFFVARLLQACKPLKLKSPKVLVETEIGLADAEHAFVLGGTGIGAEINQVGDAGLLHADAIGLVVVFQVESQVSSGFEIVFPTEMVGRIAFLEPVGRLPFDFRVEGGITPVFARRSDELFPLSSEVEIADLVAQGDEFAMPCDARRLEQVDDDAAVHAELLIVARKYGFAFKVVEKLHFIEAVRETRIKVKWNVVVVFLVAQAVPFQCVANGPHQSGVRRFRYIEQSVERLVEGYGGGGLVVVEFVVQVTETVANPSQSEFPDFGFLER